MMKRILFVVLCLTGPASLAYTPRQHIPIEEHHNLKTVKFLVGEEVVVKLMCSPGTGQSWDATVSDKDVLVELEPPRFEPLPENEGKVGGKQLHVFRYITKKPGKVRFSAIYTRAGVRGGAKSFEVTIEVKELR